MSTTVTYKGNTIATVNNNTKTLKTAGKYMEDDVTLVDVSGGASAISVIDELDVNGGTIRHINAVDLSNDTVTAAHLEYGYTAHDSQGEAITGELVPGGGGTPRTSSDLTVSGATVTAPAGVYASDASKSVATMTLPTTTSSSATSGYTSKATLDRSTSDRYINIDPGYNSAGGYYKISKVANGTVTAPASISGSSATVSTGTNTLTLTKTVSVTPSVSTAGYVSSGTAGNSSVSLTASVTTKAAATYHPSTSDQTVSASQYLTGAQTIKAVTHNLDATKILSGTTFKIGDSTDDDCVASVSGSVTFQTIYSGSSAPSSSIGVNGDIYIQT